MAWRVLLASRVARRFQELQCWQLAREVKRQAYAILGRAPLRSDRDFCDDLRRSGRSAPANIAEGFGRRTHREFAHFLSIAHGSLLETENHFHHAHDVGGLSEGEWTEFVTLARRAQKATAALRKYLLDHPHGSSS
jgi:four helix bundle protein